MSPSELLRRTLRPHRQNRTHDRILISGEDRTTCGLSWPGTPATTTTNGHTERCNFTRHATILPPGICTGSESGADRFSAD
jgi:hypothetical protein